MITKSGLAIFAACMAIAGFAPAARAGLFSATGEVIAVAADDVYVGEAEGHLDGSGTVVLRSQKNPALKCVGDFTSSAERAAPDNCIAAITPPEDFISSVCPLQRLWRGELQLGRHELRLRLQA